MQIADGKKIILKKTLEINKFYGGQLYTKEIDKLPYILTITGVTDRNYFKVKEGNTGFLSFSMIDLYYTEKLQNEGGLNL